MSDSFKFKIGCAVPKYEYAAALAEGIRLFDEDAYVHIKESQEDDFYEFIAQFNLDDKTGLEALMIGSIFEKSVIQVGGRKL